MAENRNVLALCGLMVLGPIGIGCRAPTEDSGTAGEDAVAPAKQQDRATGVMPFEASSAPLAASASSAATEQGPFQFLAARFDSDHDGRILPHEMSARAESFRRLDRDGDGAITPSDFARGSSRPPRGMRAEAEAQRVVQRIFQADGERTLSRRELARSFEFFDRDRDGALVEKELWAGVRERFGDEGGALPLALRRFLERHPPFEALRAAVDTDGDRRLARAELLSFFDARDDGDGVWGTRRTATAEAARPEGPAVGTLAPDFALAGPEGGEVVRLSSFRGKKAVALIFGSYT